jgi:predicted DNA-binding transcriptional regulator YafY
MDQPKIERMLKVMICMMDPHHHTIEEIAQKLKTSPRSVYRYVNSFKNAGFVVDESQKKVPRLCKESAFFRDVSQLIYFTEEEVHIFNQLIDGLSDTNVLKENLRRKLVALYNNTSLAKCVVDSQRAVNVEQIGESIKNKKQVVLENYSSSHSNVVRNRVVEVLGFTTDYVQMWCFDVEDRKNKLFNVARVGSVRIMEKDWQFEALHQKGVIDVFRISDYGEPQRVKLKLSVMARNLLVEEYPLSEKYITQLDENHWLLDTYVSNFKGVGRFVMGLLHEVEVVDSPEFKHYIKKQFKSLSEKVLQM